MSKWFVIPGRNTKHYFSDLPCCSYCGHSSYYSEKDLHPEYLFPKAKYCEQCVMELLGSKYNLPSRVVIRFFVGKVKGDILSKYRRLYRLFREGKISYF